MVGVGVNLGLMIALCLFFVADIQPNKGFLASALWSMASTRPCSLVNRRFMGSILFPSGGSGSNDLHSV